MHKLISSFTDFMEEMLIEKNKKYGNSALEPLSIFNKEGSVSSIKVRIDDKLSRINNSTSLSKNDVYDLIGYLILLCISQKWYRRSSNASGETVYEWVGNDTSVEYDEVL